MDSRTFRLLTSFALFVFVPVALFGQTDAVDVTAIFVDGGVTIDRLVVVQIGGIVLVRGRTADPAMAVEAMRFAARHGYGRVANMIEIVPGIADGAIETRARHQLEIAQELEGCRFQIDSTGGILRLRGQVESEHQKGFAARLVGRIDGVKEVRSALTLLAASKVQGG